MRAVTIVVGFLTLRSLDLWLVTVSMQYKLQPNK